MKLQQGLRVGAVWVLLCLAKQLHIVDALGAGRQAKLALWQIMARIIEHSSRLSAVRLARSHAVCDLLDLDSFNEDDLYANLDWLHENQSKIEDRLFRATHQDSSPTLFLYDVTSSYLEGTHNDLGAFGYNRDGKSGKQQIVLGLLCDDQGVPLSMALLHGPEQIADLPVPVAESPGAVRIGHPERSHLVEYLAPNSVFNSLPRQRSSPHLRPDDRLVTIDRVLHHASLGVA